MKSPTNPDPSHMAEGVFDAWLVPPHILVSGKSVRRIEGAESCAYPPCSRSSCSTSKSKGGEPSEHRHVSTVFRLLHELRQGSGRRVRTHRALHPRAVPQLSVL